jgi:hypothetical protein
MTYVRGGNRLTTTYCILVLHGTWRVAPPPKMDEGRGRNGKKGEWRRGQGREERNDVVPTAWTNAGPRMAASKIGRDSRSPNSEIN